jgi:hypothetical protein
MAASKHRRSTSRTRARPTANVVAAPRRMLADAVCPQRQYTNPPSHVSGGVRDESSTCIGSRLIMQAVRMVTSPFCCEGMFSS